MAVSKVVYGGNTLIDLTGDSVTAEALAEGVTAHDKSGNIVTGTAAVKVSGETLIIPEGFVEVK